MNVKDLLDKIQPIKEDLMRYVRYRLRRLERKGILPKNMLTPEEIFDEVIAELAKVTNSHDDLKDIKISAFEIAMLILDRYEEKELPQKKKIPIHQLLEEELKTLEEKFTVDADYDYVLVEDLDDISYHLDEYKPKTYLLTPDLEALVLQHLQSDEKSLTPSQKHAFEHVLKAMPDGVRKIFELHLFGQLDEDEIADLMALKLSYVQRAIVQGNNMLRAIQNVKK